MKTSKTHKIGLRALIALSALCYGLSAAHAGGNHDHSGHSHGDHDGHHNHDHGSHDHGKEEKKAGPNGGRILKKVIPHIEFFVTKEGKVQLTYLDNAGKAIEPKDFKITLVGGQRTSPTYLKFSKKGNVFLSDKSLPKGNNYPVVIQIKADAESRTIRERFNLNLSDCPSCDYKEYACTCDHAHGHDHHGHSHGDGHNHKH